MDVWGRDYRFYKNKNNLKHFIALNFLRAIVLSYSFFIFYQKNVIYI